MRDLENSHNVYILGAGFSADAGFPLVNNFMYAMRDAHDWLTLNGRQDEAKAINTVLEFRLKAASAAYRIRLDLENIEELFSLASAATDDLHNPIRVAIAATLDFKQATSRQRFCSFDADPEMQLPDHWTRSTDDLNHRRLSRIPLYEFYLSALLGRLQRQPNLLPRTTFISFNYDCLVEEALSDLGLPFSYGLHSRAVEISPTVTRLKVDHSSSVKLLKLHGSTNWAVPSGKRSLIRVYDNYQDLRTHDEVPELVPPTWRKVMGPQLNDIWRAALASIGSATRLIILGFSIPETDIHFKYLVAAGLQSNISLRDIVFVNPDNERIRTRSQMLFSETTRESSRLHLIPRSIGEFLNQGIGTSAIGDFGRPMDGSIQSISH